MVRRSGSGTDRSMSQPGGDDKGRSWRSLQNYAGQVLEGYQALTHLAKRKLPLGETNLGHATEAILACVTRGLAPTSTGFDHTGFKTSALNVLLTATCSNWCMVGNETK